MYEKTLSEMYKKRQKHTFERKEEKRKCNFFLRKLGGGVTRLFPLLSIPCSPGFKNKAVHPNFPLDELTPVDPQAKGGRGGTQHSR